MRNASLSGRQLPDELGQGPVGAALVMTAGSAAQVLLAWEPLTAVLPILPRCTFTGRTLAEVRRRGWAQSVADRAPGLASVSAPVRDRAGRVIASVSIRGAIDRMGRQPATATPWPCYAPANACPACNQTAPHG